MQANLDLFFKAIDSASYNYVNLLTAFCRLMVNSIGITNTLFENHLQNL